MHNNPVRLVDPDGMEAEDWYEDSEGNVVYDENVKSQADLDNLGIKAYYLGKSGFGINESTGMGVQYNSDGTTQEVDNMLGTVTISASRSSIMYSSYASAASGILTTVGELKHSGRLGLGIWMGKNGKFYSQSAAAGKARPFYGNQYTGSINEAKSIARPLKVGGIAFGFYNYAAIGYSYMSGNMSNNQLIGESAANTITTFGGIYGVAFGLGWEFGRAITNTNVFQEYVLKKQGGKDGLLSTPQ